MKTLESFDFGTSRGGKSTYDWTTLMNGGIHQMEAGEGKDYACKTETFVMMARKQAKTRQLALRIKKVKGGIVMQAAPFENVKVDEKVQADALATAVENAIAGLADGIPTEELVGPPEPTNKQKKAMRKAAKQ